MVGLSGGGGFACRTASNQGRVFDAAAIGEYERAFCRDQFREVVSQLNELDVEASLPEASGPATTRMLITDRDAIGSQ